MHSPANVQVVWFKRDLRVDDHAPLAEAARRGPTLALYVYEASLCTSPEYAYAHHDFLKVSLRELDEALRAQGSYLLLRRGELPAVFEVLRRELGNFTLWSHTETGNGLSYARDLRVRDWADTQGIAWHELPQNGVIRRLKRRDGWARRWHQRMSEPLHTPPAQLPAAPPLRGCGVLDAKALEVRGEAKPEAQAAGARAGKDCLRSFLRERGENYRSAMSSPLEGWDACSRLSPHLAFGTISLRQCFHATRSQRRALDAEARGGPASAASKRVARWQGALKAFESRLAWHCHFMQKLEDEPRIEFENMCRSLDGLRENDFNPQHFDAWCRGETGFPMVDACMRALHRAGWINFRMRAMLVSFAAYHLWLHWREPALHLARHFLDFEAGIHFSQMQMQSGTTAINAMRVYSPAKQARDQDPDGTFIRRYLPELAPLPTEYLAAPHTTPPLLQHQLGCVIGRDYPAPIVEAGKAMFVAKQRMARARRQPEARAEAAAIFDRHGSRAGPRRPRRR